MLLLEFQLPKNAAEQTFIMIFFTLMNSKYEGYVIYLS